MGAIRRVDLRGFMGEVYICYPFPEDISRFKQNPDGHQTQTEMKRIIAKYGTLHATGCSVEPRGNALNIGDFRFSRSQCRGSFATCGKAVTPAGRTIEDRITSTKWSKTLSVQLVPSLLALGTHLIFDPPTSIFRQ